MKPLNLKEKKRIIELILTGEYTLRKVASLVHRSESTVSKILSNYLKSKNTK